MFHQPTWRAPKFNASYADMVVWKYLQFSEIVIQWFSEFPTFFWEETIPYVEHKDVAVWFVNHTYPVYVIMILTLN